MVCRSVFFISDVLSSSLLSSFLVNSSVIQLIFWRSMVRCYGQHFCFTSGLQSAVHRLNFTLTDILAFCKPGCHSWEATPAPKMTLIKDPKSFPLPIASGIHRYKNPSVLYNFYSNVIEHLRLCIHPGVVN